MTIEENSPNDPRRTVFWPQDRFKLLERINSLGLYRGNYTAASTELLSKFYLQPGSYPKLIAEKAEIKDDLRKISKRILSGKIDETIFSISIKYDNIFTDRNLIEAFAGRIKKKRQFQEVETDFGISFKPVEPIAGIDRVTIDTAPHRIVVSIQGEKVEKKIQDRQAELIGCRIDGIINHQFNLSHLHRAEVRELNLEGLYFLGMIDDFDFTTENFVKQNKIWAEQLGCRYFDLGGPEFRVSTRSQSPKLATLGTTQSEMARIEKGTESWILTAVQNQPLLPLRSRPITNFFIVPSPSIAEVTGL